MANVQGVALSFLLDLLNGRQAFGTSVTRATTDPDTFKGALYLSSATITPSTTAYTSSGEVTGTGYTAGGEEFTFGVAPALDGVKAIVTPSASLEFTGVSIGPFDCCLMYNDTLAGKNAVGPFTFAPQTIVAGNFALTMPVNDATTALIRLGETTP